ncbi:putative cytokinetic ring protein SteA [Saccharopolyspora phatthalungensis]|uniref:Putative membrane-anchored protein n=1 Tax=Saccharopolyspora phatthalungensis TaxID=664693 RepID=A0A840Q2F1_9PSEU|nr:putative cytokinetic ring protein SteA [Saccharopolyspora phatthalungensis]MBB5156692.1 putative membrane-anchored protein [Saccharopolyspora phatthalungensis]
MKLSGLLARQQESLPGIAGIARVERRSGDVLRRVRSGDIAVIDHADLDRRTAEALVSAGVVGVVNAVPSISGRYPNLGPEVLLSAGVALVDGVGPEVAHRVKDGAKIRLHEGGVFVGDREVGRGTQQDANSVADLLIEAKAGMSAQLEAFSANTIEFLRRERTLILDGVGVPELTVPMAGRQVLVVAPGYGHADDLQRLRKYIREYRPVLIGVESGAEALRKAGYKPNVIVGDPDGIATTMLKCGAELVIPAHLDGHAPGLERIQDLGIGAVTFPASGNPEDLALLLADAHKASLVITVGFQATLGEFLDRGRSGSNPSTFLTRLRLGSKVIDGPAVAALQRSRTPVSAVVLLVASVLLVVVVALLVSGLGTAFLGVLADTGDDVSAYFKGLFT